MSFRATTTIIREGVQYQFHSPLPRFAFIPHETEPLRIGDSFLLEIKSEVFQRMFDDPDQDSDIELPDFSFEQVQIFLLAIEAKASELFAAEWGRAFNIPRRKETLRSIDWEDARAALKLCKTFDCGIVAPLILCSSLEFLRPKDFWDALQAACEHNHAAFAFRILLRGHLRQRAAGHEVTKSGLAPPPQWTAAEQEALSKTWIWVLMRAAMDAERLYVQGSEGQSEEYWKTLAHAFLKRVD